MAQRIEMPKEGSQVYFWNHKKRLPVPFVIYADFEALTSKIDSCSPKGDKSYTQAYQKHEPSGFGYKVVCHYDKKYSKPAVIYHGENVIQKFIRDLYLEVSDLQRIITKDFQKPLIMTESDEKDFQNTKKCWICQKRMKNYLFEIIVTSLENIVALHIQHVTSSCKSLLKRLKSQPSFIISRVMIAILLLKN